MLRFTNMEVVGFIPQFLDEKDPRSAVEQIDNAYQPGGGWRDFDGFELIEEFNLLGGDGKSYFLKYPGDPLMRELSRATLRDETLVFFQSSWFAVIQTDGSYRVARLD